MQDYIPIQKDINGKIDDVFVKQYDHNSRYISLQLTDKDLDGAPISLEGCAARLFVQTDDGAGTLVNGEIADGENGIVSFLLPNTVTKTAGKFLCEIRLTEPASGATISTKVFYLVVEESIFNDDAYTGTLELSALQQALNELDGIKGEFKTLSLEVDSDSYAKPLFMADISGYAAQSMCILGQSGGHDIYLIGFAKSSDATKSLLMVYSTGTKTILARKEFSYGHVNSMAIDGDGVVYIPNATDHSVYRFTVTSYSESDITLSTLGNIVSPDGWVINDVFGLNGIVYANGTHSGNNYYWKLGDTDTAVKIALPAEMPRVSQSWSTDGKYLYVLRSSPNAMAVYDFKSGKFVRWVNIGDYIGSTFPIGEIEELVFTDSGAMLLSQLFYDLPDKTTRFWLISELKPSSEIVPDQQHIYPNEERVIYVGQSNAGTSFRTNPINDNQTGSSAYPYHSLNAAIYAASATPENKVKIIVKNAETSYTVDYLALDMPSLDLTIQCNGTVIFDRLELKSGRLTIAGDATFGRLISVPNTSLSINGGIFSATGLVSGNAPYSLNGTLSIVNASYTGGSNDVLFEFGSGATGVVGFTSGSPVSNNYQQTNLTLLNVRNYGARERWTEIFSDGTVAIGTAITPTMSGFYVTDNTVYAVRWRADDISDYFNAVVHVSGDTIADLSAVITESSTVKYRVARIRLRPRVQNQSENWVNGDITVISITDYTVSDGAITSTVNNTVPTGFSIDSIAVRGY